MEFIDLSHRLYDHMPVYPGDVPFTLEKTMDAAVDGVGLHTLHTGLHVGTHIDVPMHMLADSRYTADFPLERFMGLGLLIDVRGCTRLEYKPEYEALIQEGHAVLFFTGWSQYFESDTDKYYHEHPQMDGELAEFLLRKKVKLVGVDMPSIERDSCDLHRLLLGNDIMQLENLTNLEALLEYREFELFAVPLKIEGEGCPVRAWARGFKTPTFWEELREFFRKDKSQ